MVTGNHITPIMTAYTISVGYNSGHKKSDVSKTLINVVDEIRDDPERIEREIARVEGSAYSSMLVDYCECYRKPEKDLTIVINQDEDKLALIIQYASGSGSGREVKERCRRAFCRLVIEEMHRRGMEVCLIVG